MNLLTTPVLYGCAAIAVAGLAFGGVQTYRLNSAKAKGAACQIDRANFASTQANNLQLIEDLRRERNALIEMRRVEREATGKALTELDKLALQADRKNEAQARELETLYARDTGARKWADSGVDAGVASRLPGAKR